MGFSLSSLNPVNALKQLPKAADWVAAASFSGFAGVSSGLMVFSLQKR